MPNDPEADKLLPIDPPDNQGGGNIVAPTSPEVAQPEAAPIDPPDNQGGG